MTHYCTNPPDPEAVPTWEGEAPSQPAAVVWDESLACRSGFIGQDLVIRPVFGEHQ
jgi:hypothetical protein